jgi:DNA-binding GntR family transcriptional regulator
MTQFRVDRPASLTDLAHSRLRQAILDGVLAAGQRISIVALAAEMGISRSPVRTAVERLHAEGLLVPTPTGSVVQLPPRGELLEALEVRRPLESLATALTAARCSAGQLRVLRQLHGRFEKAVFGHRHRLAQELDVEFHLQIREASGNRVLAEHLRQLQGKVVLGASTIRPPHDVREHEAILTALRQRDAARAADTADAHLAGVIERTSRASVPPGDHETHRPRLPQRGNPIGFLQVSPVAGHQPKRRPWAPS